MDSDARYVFATCQVGAEAALKREVARRWPAFRFAYSRPGFLTFRVPVDPPLGEDFDLDCALARASGWTLGKVTGETDAQLAAAAWQVVGERAFDACHVWQRDLRASGDRGYLPGPCEADRVARAALADAAPKSAAAMMSREPPAADGARVLDCILVQPREWWLGWHVARGGPSSVPGGFFVPATAEPDVPPVSRAFYKMEEALWWSRLPVKPGERVVELGCAPGGSCQALLSRGLIVTGIDPATVDPAVAANANFTHVRKRAADVRRREFRKTRWLTADMNVAPQYTLDAVEAIVTHDEVPIDGLLLTLKLPDWLLADELPQWLSRVRSWGYPQVAARQLHHGRQEICVAALSDKAVRRLRRGASRRAVNGSPSSTRRPRVRPRLSDREGG